MLVTHISFFAIPLPFSSTLLDKILTIQKLRDTLVSIGRKTCLPVGRENRLAKMLSKLHVCMILEPGIAYDGLKKPTFAL